MHDGRVPRLDVVCAVAGGTTAFITAEVATEPDTMRVSYEALLVGVVMGALVGLGVRAWLVREPYDATRMRRWLPIMSTWLAGGLLTSAVVAVGTHLMRWGEVNSFTLEAFGIGVLGTVLSLPACVWLTSKARAARRARHGSLVAALDRRAIVGALLACMALETLLLLPNWRLAHYGLLQPPALALLAASAAFVGAGVLLWLDKRAARRVAALIGEVDTLDEIEAGSQRTPAVTDVGIGSETYGREEHGQAYRRGKRRIPLVRGSPEHAAAMLRRSVQLSWLRCLLLLLPALFHLYEATHPPRDTPARVDGV
jgi:hypothetical protein